jgi:acetylornithine deacetylase/succinyl-diaminopimelate desuccinylase-like protein
MEDILQKLVGYQTVDGNADAERQALEYIAQFLTDRGMFVTHFTFGDHRALVATTKQNNKQPQVMFAAHVDVVPGPDELFTMQKHDDKLFGRGVYDMKFAIACYMQLVDELRDKIGSYDFGIMITADEELGNAETNGTKMVVAEGYRPQAAILPDGGDDWHIERFAKGAWHFDIEATGRSAHGSRPWEGESAADVLLDTLQDIRELFTEFQKPETPTLNIGKIIGGEARNQVASSMTAGIDIRVPSKESLTQLKATIKKICSKRNVVLREVITIDPFVTDLEHPLVKQFMMSKETVTGKPCESSISFGASDGQYFGEVGVPCVLCEPLGGGRHAADEWLDVQSFHDYKDVLADYLYQLQMQA